MASSFAQPNSTFFFFWWGYLQNKVCSSCPGDLNALKQAIRDEIANISVDTLREVMRSFATHVHLCFQEGDRHLKEIVYKK
jgi:undecaprenyl pyrophosphate synthase